MAKTLSVIGYFLAVKIQENLYIDSKYGQLLDDLAPHFETIYYIASDGSGRRSSKPEEYNSYTYVVKSPNIQIVLAAPSDYQSGPLSKLIAWVKRIGPYWSCIKQSNFVYITLPGYSGFLAHLICRILRKPYCLYFGSDWQEVAPFMANWNGIARIFLPYYTLLSQWSEKTAVQGSAFTIVHGKKLKYKFEKLGSPIIETVPMVSLTPKMFYYREDTCQNSPYRCLFVGSIIQRKGIHDLVDAISILIRRGISIELHLAGSGNSDYTQMITNKIADMELGQSVKTLGHISDFSQLLSLYRQADIFILPTYGEGFPRVIYEAMSQGLPIITSNIDTLASVLNHNGNAILVKPGDAPKLADEIERLLTDNSLRKQLIKNGYDFVNSKISETRSSQQILSLIEQYTLNT